MCHKQAKQTQTAMHIKIQVQIRTAIKLIIQGVDLTVLYYCLDKLVFSAEKKKMKKTELYNQK